MNCIIPIARPLSATILPGGFIPPHEAKCQLKIPGCTDETAALEAIAIAPFRGHAQPIHRMAGSAHGLLDGRLRGFAPLLGQCPRRILVWSVGLQPGHWREGCAALPRRCRANARCPLLSQRT